MFAARLLALLAVAGALVSAPLQQPATAAVDRDHVIYWNEQLRDAFRRLTGEAAAPTYLARAAAMVHGAIYDATNSVKCVRTVSCLGPKYLIQVPVRAGSTPDVDTAIDYAAFNTLKDIWPNLDFKPAFDAAQAAISPDVTQVQRTDGAAIGSQAASAMLQARGGDGSTDATTYLPSTVAGFWRPTGSGPPLAPNWGKVRPFVLTSGSQFRPPLPGGFTTMADLLTSDAYAAQVNEVKRLGATSSTARTPDETKAAFFWANDVDATYKPIGQIFANTHTIAKQKQMQVSGTAKLFALLSFALADASVAAWDAKYLTDIDLWRPESAITLDGDNNAQTIQDPLWTPLSKTRTGTPFSPPFPSYISGHATFAGAWSRIMSFWFFGDTLTFDAGTEDPNAQGVIRRFTSFSAAARENALSRVWLGVHYPWDATEGLSTGGKVADHTTANYLGVNTAVTWVPFGNQYNQDTCPVQGAKLVAEHRWTQYRCEVLSDGATFQLMVK